MDIMKRFSFDLVLLLIITASCLPSYGKTYYLKGRDFYADGKSNDYYAFRKLAEEVNSRGRGKLVFEKGKTYYIEIPETKNERNMVLPQDDATILGFLNCKKLDIDMNGATIVVGPNHRMEYCILLLFNCSGFKLHNGNLVGDAIGHDYSKVTRNGKIVDCSHEWGYGMSLRGSQGRVYDMNVSYMTGDGIYTGSIKYQNSVCHSRLNIKDCEISHCRRNGITIASSEGITIDNINIHHIGSYDGIQGTNPQTGIDIEYEDGVYDTGDIHIIDCSFVDCTRRGISTSNSTPPTPMHFYLDRSSFTKADVLLNNMKQGESKNVSECVFNQCCLMAGDAFVRNCRFNLGKHITYISKTHFKDCEFNGVSVSEKSTDKGCAFAGFSLEKAIFEGCSFNNIQGNSTGNVVYQGFSGYIYPLYAEFINCTFQNTSFCRGGSDKKSQFVFKNCTLKPGCTIVNLDSEEVSFSRCSLYDVNSYVTQGGYFSFVDCDIHQTDKSIRNPLILYGTHKMKNCTVVNEIDIPSDAKKRGIKSFKIDVIK